MSSEMLRIFDRSICRGCVETSVKKGGINFQLNGILSIHKMQDLIKKIIVKNLFLNNQPDAPFIQIYSVIKLYIFRASSVPIISSFLLYIRHW